MRKLIDRMTDVCQFLLLTAISVVTVWFIAFIVRAAFVFVFPS